MVHLGGVARGVAGEVSDRRRHVAEESFFVFWGGRGVGVLALVLFAQFLRKVPHSLLVHLALCEWVFLVGIRRFFVGVYL